MISVSRLKTHDSSSHRGEQLGLGCPPPPTPALSGDRACTLEPQLSDCDCPLVVMGSNCLDVSVVSKEMEKPSPPQKPLPADPRSTRVVRSPSVVQGHILVQGPSVVCVPPTAPRGPTPVRPALHPMRSVLPLARFMQNATLLMTVPALVPLLDPVPNTPQLYQSLASLPTSNSTAETQEEVAIRH